MRLEKYTHLLAGTFFRLNVLSIWVPVDKPQRWYVTPHYGVRVLLAYFGIWTEDIVLSSVITFNLFCHNDGWLLHTRILSCGGYAFFQVYKN